MCKKKSFKYLDDISHLKLTTYIETILRRKGINKISDISSMDEMNLKEIPGIGYASARKIMKAYDIHTSTREKQLEAQTQVCKKNDTNVSQLPDIDNSYIPIHPIIAQSSLAETDKRIVSYIIQGHTLRAVQWKLGISKRSLKHRIAMLKLDYAANTLPQLIINIIDSVYTGKKATS